MKKRNQFQLFQKQPEARLERLVYFEWDSFPNIMLENEEYLFTQNKRIASLFEDCSCE